MNRFQATSRCECQALLTAVLDEKRHVIEGSASIAAPGEGQPGAREKAPALARNRARRGSSACRASSFKSPSFRNLHLLSNTAAGATAAANVPLTGLGSLRNDATTRLTCSATRGAS